MTLNKFKKVKVKYYSIVVEQYRMLVLFVLVSMLFY